MSERPDDFIVVHPTTRLTEAEAEAFRAGALAGLQKGAARERRAIVAWLRSEACFTWLLHNTGGFTRDQASNLAAAIDQSEHLRGDDE